MDGLSMVPVQARSIDALADVLPAHVLESVQASLDSLRQTVAGRAMWEINTTSCGGGVAEMLQSLLAYMRGAGIDSRWAVLQGDPYFFRITKRLHHALHGAEGDGSPLGAEERAHYEHVSAANAEEIVAAVRPDDLVVLHDPQTAGLIPHLERRHCKIIWRCHIGHDQLDENVAMGWSFLRPYLEHADRYVFTRSSFVPKELDPARTAIITPCIDPLSPKNQPMDGAVARAILTHTGLVEGGELSAPMQFKREDGSLARVDHCAEVIRLGRAPRLDDPLIVQVSRWDELKDPFGVMEGFARALSGGSLGGANLLIAGPNAMAVADDPEGAETFERVLSCWRELPEGVRQRVHLASLPMADREENAAIVNALQRQATIVVQKSLHEGFGLTVTEPMWKSKPVVASAVGGIRDQIESGVDGLLLHDPRDLDEFGELLRRLLFAPELAARLGRNGRRKVEQRFLFDRFFERIAGVIRSMDQDLDSAQAG